jgi:hypothetical protein
VFTGPDRGTGSFQSEECRTGGYSSVEGAIFTASTGIDSILVRVEYWTAGGGKDARIRIRARRTTTAADRPAKKPALLLNDILTET